MQDEVSRCKAQEFLDNVNLPEKQHRKIQETNAKRANYEVKNFILLTEYSSQNNFPLAWHHEPKFKYCFDNSKPAFYLFFLHGIIDAAIKQTIATARQI
jgi:hypothetical protein